MSDKPNISDPWREWREQQIAKLDLGEIGLDGLWVKARLTSSMTNAEVKAMSGAEDEMEESMKKWIVDWNLPGPDGEVLALPKESNEWAQHVPLGVLVSIAKMIAEADEERLGVPTQSVKR